MGLNSPGDHGAGGGDGDGGKKRSCWTMFGTSWKSLPAEDSASSVSCCLMSQALPDWKLRKPEIDFVSLLPRDTITL